MIKVEQLFCSSNQLTELDLSKNVKLKELSYHHNQLTKLLKHN